MPGNSSLLGSLVLLLFLSACAPAVKEEFIAWPPLAEDPKIAYMRYYRGDTDFRQITFLDRIFGVPGESSLMKPYGVFARSGKIYVTTTFGDVNVTVIDTVNKTVNTIGNRGRIRLSFPTGIAVTKGGEIYVSDTNKRAIFVFDADGNLRQQINCKDVVSPAGIALDEEAGRIYVADSRGHQVVAYSLKGEKVLQIGTRGSEDGKFNFPTNIALGPDGIYVVDTQNFRVQVFDREGKFLRRFGELGDGPGNFARPKGIGIDSEGHVYVADASFNNVQIFNGQGQLMLHFSEPGFGPGQLQVPAGLFVDEQDHIYVADQLNGRVLEFQYMSEPWKKAHPDLYRKFITAPVPGS